jgi:preprotein translocase subunit SecA
MFEVRHDPRALAVAALALPHRLNSAKSLSVDSPLRRIYARLSVHTAPFRLRRAQRVAENAVKLEARFVGTTDDALAARARELGATLRRHGLRDEVVAEAMALVRETCRRRIGLTPFHEQLVAGYLLLCGAAVEMDTGEGKTLTSVISSAIHALSGRFVHVVSPNDYLAERDGQLLRPALEGLGVSVGIVMHDTPTAERRAAYRCDVTFVSNKEVAFDYLRDRLLTENVAGDRNIHFKVRKAITAAGTKSEPILRGLDVAIVDEIDSILIDDAVTPLLISAESDAALDPEVVRTAATVADELTDRVDFVIHHEISAELTPRGEEAVDHLTANLPGIWRQRIRRYEIVGAAIVAYRCLQRDRQYLVRDGRVIIIDENTGRTMPDRYWGRDLHMIVEMKEGCASSGHRKSLASISFQRFFRTYRTLAGMSGTVREVAVELAKVYDLSMTRVPRRRPLRRRFLGRRIFPDRACLWAQAAKMVADIHGSGQPVLIGVRSVAEAERGSKALAEMGVEHTVLSAAHDTVEADIVARAGHRGSVTIATNMAGRGTDIKLGPGVTALGGLVVMICERHDFRRIDRQLMGRCGRQGDPGDVIELVSRDDQVLGLSPRWLVALLEAPLVGRAATALAFLQAQRRAERMQAQRRLDLVRRDERLRRVLAFAGGLD